ncbi:hypothetical protein JW960_21315 [candidate division KSB1 bacterium]|nr:hypothetical protein [candidate division KSB1 bacterium]
MKKNQFIGKWTLTVGIIIGVIGVIHNCFTPTLWQQALNDGITHEQAAGFAYFFLLSGSAFILAGLLMAFASFDLKKSARWAWQVVLINCTFVALAGIGAIAGAGFRGNLLIYVLCLGSISTIFLLLRFRKELVHGTVQ